METKFNPEKPVAKNKAMEIKKISGKEFIRQFEGKQNAMLVYLPSKENRLNEIFEFLYKFNDFDGLEYRGIVKKSDYRLVFDNNSLLDLKQDADKKEFYLIGDKYLVYHSYFTDNFGVYYKTLAYHIK